MGRVRGGAPRRAKSTTSRLRRPRPMPPSERWRLLANRSDLSFIARTKMPSLQSLPTLQPATASAPPQPRFGSHPDDTTPIPRPSHYYGRRHQGSMTELLRQDQAKHEKTMQRRRPWRLSRRSGSGQNRQEPTRHCRTQAPARQGAPEIRGLTTVSGLRAATIRPPSSAFCAAAGNRSQGQ